NLGLFSVSTTGAIAFFAGPAVESQLAWVDRRGQRVGTPGPIGIFNSMSMAPDDGGVVYDQADPRTGSVDLGGYDFARGVPSRLTFHPSHDMFPMWSVDGAKMAFSSLRAGPLNLFMLGAGDAGNESLLLRTDLPKIPSSWTRDGRFLVYSVTHP